MRKNKEYTDSEWDEIAAALSGERSSKSVLLDSFLEEDATGSAEKWKELAETADTGNIDVDKAWNRLQHSIAAEAQQAEGTAPARIRILKPLYLKIAAAVILLAAIGSLTFYLNRNLQNTDKGYFATGDGEKLIGITLPDGSRISLNSNSSLRYSRSFGKKNRDVELSGEAYFDITPDASKPFVIDAGNASIKVVGTSFNVITNNSNSEVEVFVTSGKVMLSGIKSPGSIMLEPGYIGRLGGGAPLSSMNDNPNYMAWENGHLEYNGQRLEVVFRDLKRAYNMNITADDPSVLDYTWTTASIDNQPEETIINLICLSFNLSYTFEGNSYRLIKK